MVAILKLIISRSSMVLLTQSANRFVLVFEESGINQSLPLTGKSYSIKLRKTSLTI